MAEKDNWNPIYASYVLELVKTQNKVTEFKKLVDKKLREETGKFHEFEKLNCNK